MQYSVVICYLFMINFDIVDDIPTTNKTIFLLTDLDVPLNENGAIIDDTKIKKAMPTIKYLVKTGARVVIATHLGYPASEVDYRFSTKVLAKYLNRELKCEVRFSNDCVGDNCKREIFRTSYGDVIVLENLLFHKEEKDCDLNFARNVADGMNVYVNDSFEYSLKPYASVLGVPLFIRATAGLVLSENVKILNSFINCGNKFITAIIGGKNFNQKIEMIDNLSERCKCIILGDEISTTFLVALGKKVGKTIFNKNNVVLAERIINKAIKSDCLILTPKDFFTTKSITDYKNIKHKNLEKIEDDDIIIDIGKESIKTIFDMLKLSKYVLWYDCLNNIDFQKFNFSTKEIANYIATLTKKKKIYSIISGKDTTFFLKKTPFWDNFSFKAECFNATNNYLSGKILPGLEILKRLAKQPI